MTSRQIVLSALFFLASSCLAISQKSQTDSLKEHAKAVEQSSEHIESGGFFNSWINMISAGFGLVGAIGTGYTILSYRKTKQQGDIYKYLFDLAEKNLDHSITEQTISEKKREVERVSKHIESLQEHIRKTIPIEAKRTVLRDKLNSQIETLMQTFHLIQHIQKELGHIEHAQNIPPEILKAIESEISPSYVLKETQSRLKTYLTVLTTLAAILSAVLIPPLDRWVSAVILIFAVPIVLRLVRTYLPVDSYARRSFVLKACVALLAILASSGLLVSSLVFLTISRRELSSVMEFVTIVLVASVVSAVFAFVLWRKFLRSKRAVRQ